MHISIMAVVFDGQRSWKKIVLINDVGWGGGGRTRNKYSYSRLKALQTARKITGGNVFFLSFNIINKMYSKINLILKSLSSS